jgi:long-subunit fatty acid transport protein
VRTLVRDAAIGPDAVYYNPAGLTKLEDGFHFSLNSQTIFQNKDVTNDYQFLSPRPKKYLGDVLAPVFPSFYATWKKDKIAISFGFNPVGGGGGATFEDGLPSFELGVSDMVPSLADYGATAYRREVYFKGTSVYFGYQLGVTYQINDVISVYAGARYVSVKNTYEGYLRNVEVNMGGTVGWIPVNEEFGNLAGMATQGIVGAKTISTNMGKLIGAGLPGAYTLQQVVDAGYLRSGQRDTIAGGLLRMDLDPTVSIGEIQTDCNDAALGFRDDSTSAATTAALTTLLFNQEADVVQKGHGITPIIGVNLSFGDKLNIGMKYEFKTKIDVENDTKSDFIADVTATGPVYMFKDGAKVSSDMPAMFSMGVDYKVTPKFSATAGFHYYWDKAVNYGKTLNGAEVDNSKIIDNNYYELGLGLEYGITDKLLLSAGYLLAKTGVSEEYQNDLSYSLTSNTVGGGLGYKLTEKLMINAGVSYSIYNEGTKTYEHRLKTSPTTYVPINCTDTYFKDTLILALGLDFSF